ncbi:MAG TPA: hypothetical protein VFQ07_06760 [Candidatus Polarisedimenticolia bacterium]|nr:hypothetical protein [Candidatus Polarisedimenticolia bacterium]
MGKKDRIGGRARLALPVLVVLGAGFAGCNDNSGDTVNVNGLDCGLVRDDMVGTWSVTYTPAARTLMNCDNATFNGSTVTVVGGTVNFATQFVTASGGSTSFIMNAKGPAALNNELMANIEADSCLALVQIWEDDEQGWLQCIGTADLSSHLLSVICDSFDLDTDADGAADTACSLNGSITGTVGLP